MPKLPTWGDLHNATFQEIKKTYKLTDKQLEMGVRKHLDGANREEMKTVYKQVWTPEDKR